MTSLDETKLRDSILTNDDIIYTNSGQFILS